MVTITDWFQEHAVLLTGLAIASIIVFVGSLILLPIMIARIPPDYYTHTKRPPSIWATPHPVVRIALQIIKNSLGVLLMLAGIAMLVTPGQGFLTLLMGFFLIEFPGKYRFERWLIRRDRVLRTINWMRRRSGREPMRTAH